MKGYSRIFSACALVGLGLSVGACGAAKSIPAIAPIVAAAIPSALTTTLMQSQQRENLAALSVLYSPFMDGPTLFAEATDPVVKAAMQAIFNQTYSKVSGGSAKGFFNAALEDLDSRASEVSSRMAGKSSCAGTTDYTASLSAISSTNVLTIKPACKTTFSGGAEGAGSGLAYGEWTEGGKDTRGIWLHLAQSNGTDRFGYMAKVTDAAATSVTSKGADIMFLESFPSIPRHSFYRLTGNPSTNTFELSLASTSSSATNPASGTSSNFGCGIRMKSDGTNIRVAGTGGSGTCGANDTITDFCIKASDLTVQTDSVCSTITFTYTAMTHSTMDTTTKAALDSAIKLTAATLTEL